jgi:hypothetical protein
LSFGDNYNKLPSDPLTLQIRIVAQKTTTVNLTFKDNPTLNTAIPVNAGSVVTYNLSLAQKIAVYSNVTGASDKSLRIQSTEPISVYALNQFRATTDATFVLPTDVLGTDYYHLSYRAYNGGAPDGFYDDGYTIVATQDNTKIYENDTYKITLQSGQVYSAYYYDEDITGYHITASAPIAYFVTNQLATIPYNITARDHLYEQMVPVNSWGRTFVVPVTKRGVERVRIVASHDGTVITQSGGVIQNGIGQASLNLNKGQFVELEIKLITRGCYISSNKPVGVASYLVGIDY